jgi:drug/metabolite transporter (DMT)-like permease
MKIFAVFILMICCTVAANLLLKQGASAQDIPQDFFSKVLSWQVLAGLTFFGLAAINYLLILTWLPLNVAQSFSAVQFVAVIFAARYVLSEPINPAQWLGISLIALGIVVVGWSR